MDSLGRSLCSQPVLDLSAQVASLCASPPWEDFCREVEQLSEGARTGSLGTARSLQP